MIWLIGGTSESRLFREKLHSDIQCITSVASPEGAKLFDGYPVVSKRMTEPEMVKFIREHRISAIFDLSHPFATLVSQSAYSAAVSTGISYNRYSRPDYSSDQVHCFSSLNHLLDHLKELKGTFFFSTGSKNIADFEAVRGSNRFIYRILPTPESMQIARNHQVDISNLIAMKGPLSDPLEVAFLKHFQPDYAVMKNSGKSGGTPEKISACQKCEIPVLLLDKPNDSGYTQLNDLIQIANQPG